MVAFTTCLKRPRLFHLRPYSIFLPSPRVFTSWPALRLATAIDVCDTPCDCTTAVRGVLRGLHVLRNPVRQGGAVVTFMYTPNKIYISLGPFDNNWFLHHTVCVPNRSATVLLRKNLPRWNDRGGTCVDPHNDHHECLST